MKKQEKIECEICGKEFEPEYDEENNLVANVCEDCRFPELYKEE